MEWAVPKRWSKYTTDGALNGFSVHRTNFDSNDIYNYYSFMLCSQCTTLSTANSNLVMFGTCVSADKCRPNEGLADGNCASGYFKLQPRFFQTFID